MPLYFSVLLLLQQVFFLFVKAHSRVIIVLTKEPLLEVLSLLLSSLAQFDGIDLVLSRFGRLT